MMQRNTVFTTVMLALISVTPLLPACQAQPAWPVYDNKPFAYSLSYPPGWAVSEPFQNRQLAVIKSPDAKQTISIMVVPSRYPALDQAVSFYMSTTRTGSFYYKLISSENIKHQGIEARQLQIEFQDQSNSPILYVKELYIINIGSLYLVRIATEINDPAALSSLFRQVSESFRFSG